MNPHQLIGLVGPANNFTMGCLPMHLTQPLLMEGKFLPKVLFLDIMVEKCQILVNFVKDHHVSLCVTANIGRNTTTICVYDNFATINTQIIQVTVSNLPNLENQLFQLYTEVSAVVHDFLPDDIDSMPSLEDITDDDSRTVNDMSYNICIFIKYKNSGTSYMKIKLYIHTYIRVV